MQGEGSRGTENPSFVSVRGITKRFGDAMVLDGVSLDVRKGQVHAVLGENGAGKSTLMNCLLGLHELDGGEILVHGRPVKIANPRDAAAFGFGMVHQHFKLVPSMTVSENVFLGHELRNRFGLVNRAAQDERTAGLAASLGLTIDPRARLADLSIGGQQRVEILRAVSRDTELLILDEPTAVLTPQEAGALFEVIRNLVDKGLAVLLVSHRLGEVKGIADVVSVLRRGKLVATADPATASLNHLAELIVGRSIVVDDPPPAKEPGKQYLVASNLNSTDARGVPVLKDVSLCVRSGEIVGVAGVSGNGQSELVEALTGLLTCDSGSIEIMGEAIADPGVRRMREAGIAHIPEDRMGRGVSLWSPLYENLAVNRLDDRMFGRGLLKPGIMTDFARDLMGKFDIRAAGPHIAAGRLSGGNIQKVIFARELETGPAIIICCEPSRGLDVGATEFLYRRLLEFRDQGAAILLVSTELSEVLRLSDRILVMHAGAIAGTFEERGPDQFEVGRLMLGLSPGRQEHAV